MVQVSRWLFFESAEVALGKRLKKNPVYPFRYLCDDGSGNSVYVHSRRSAYFYLSLIGCAVGILGLAIWLLAGGDKEFILYGVMVFVVSCYFCVEHHSVHSIVLEPASGRYAIYTDHTLTTTQQAYNIYVRLQQKRTGFRQTKYYLMINGWGFISPIIISGLTANKIKLRLLGHEVAKEMNLNYFDLSDVSHLHILRHHPTISNIAKLSKSRRSNVRLRLPSQTSGQSQSVLSGLSVSGHSQSVLSHSARSEDV